MDASQRTLEEDSPSILELVICEAAGTVSILVGVSALPLLHALLGERFWLAEGAAGLLAVAVGLIFLECHTPRIRPFFLRVLAVLKNLPTLVKRLLERLRHVWQWNLRRLPWWRKTDNAPTVPAAFPGKASLPPVVPPVESAPERAGYLPLLTLLTGLLVLLPAVLAALTHRYTLASPLSIAIYFSGPALLLWLLVEIPYLWPKLQVRPPESFTIAGLVRSTVKGMAAAMIVAFLSLALVEHVLIWLLYIGIGLSAASLVFGFLTASIVRRRQKGWAGQLKGFQEPASAQ